MSKKVIAVILSVGILTSVFTGCAQKQQEPTSGNKMLQVV
ncbi:putative secreted protein with C-terminal beta-propeller domain [Clostridium beijerinckii]|nr:putative secreted protein with C-terminal beta-propeller domain [Clostridium beijerinckii]